MLEGLEGLCGRSASLTAGNTAEFPGYGKVSDFLEIHGGEGGIRTLGTLARSTVFETAPFDHSGTSPRGVGGTYRSELRRSSLSDCAFAVVITWM